MTEEDLSSEEKQRLQFEKMTLTPVNRLIPRLAVPTMISMLVTSVYNMADTFFVGRISTEATAAVGVVFSLMAIIQAVGFFFGQGTGIFMSKLLGRRDRSMAEKTAATGFVCAIAGGALILLLGMLFIRPLAGLLGATPDIIDTSCSYMFYILLAAPLMVASFTLNNQLRFQGYAMYAMIGICAGGLLNIALDPLFIFALGMGAAGAALATAVSQCFSFTVLFVMTERKGIKIRLSNVSVNRMIMGEMARGGVPSLARQGSLCAGMMVYNNAAGLYGAVAIAAVSVVTRIMQFSAFLMIGYGQGFQPVCGYSLGAGNYPRIRQSYFFSIRSSLLFLVGLAAAGYIFAPQLVAVFRNDPEVIAIGTEALRYACISFPLFGTVIITNMMTQLSGKTVRATLLAIARGSMFFIPSILILSSLFGLEGLECAQMVSDFASFALAVPIAVSVLNSLKKEFGEIPS